MHYNGNAYDSEVHIDKLVCCCFDFSRFYLSPFCQFCCCHFGVAVLTCYCSDLSPFQDYEPLKTPEHRRPSQDCYEKCRQNKKYNAWCTDEIWIGKIWVDKMRIKHRLHTKNCLKLANNNNNDNNNNTVISIALFTEQPRAPTRTSDVCCTK